MSALGDGEAALRVEQEVEGRFVGLEGGADGFELLTRSVEAVVRGLRNGVRPLHLGDRGGHFVEDLTLLFFEDGTSAAELHFGVAGSREGASVTDGDAQLQAELPFLKVARGEVFVSVVEARIVAAGV